MWRWNPGRRIFYQSSSPYEWPAEDYGFLTPVPTYVPDQLVAIVTETEWDGADLLASLRRQIDSIPVHYFSPDQKKVLEQSATP